MPRPEVSILGADQKDRGLWGRECDFLGKKFHSPRVSPGDQPLTEEPVDSGYEIEPKPKL